MPEDLFKEIKKLMGIIENYKKELEPLEEKKEGFKSVNSHINYAIKESEEATKKIIDNILEVSKLIGEVLENISNTEDETLRRSVIPILEKSLEKLTESLTLLEFQDIVSQRLLKISGFISDLEKEVLKILILFGITEEQSQEKKEKLRGKLEELEWKKEVSQEDVDDILKQFGM